ncbi:DUF4224 domain-containing protein [Burkholderia lata]|uniref:DUF4224 domain-containing protein n=1 Tax=Burkholderia lata (strain ATCC 17760 / DSM 23089 / LMG 22485 / NCIMB 9086 / R18194 / 383) TaxID=482957 RepID=UPI001583396A|nr:DUF4224 domain-containing protein [Burkholderia lata]
MTYTSQLPHGNRYLTRDELAELVGCQPRSLACMRRWLERNSWAHAVNIAGFPMVTRDYFAARMTGATPTKVEFPAEPDFSALDSLQDEGRRRKT